MPGNVLRWRWAAFAGLILFALIQVFPMAVSTDAGEQAMSRDSAEVHAIQLAGDKFGIPAKRVDRVVITHMSDSLAVGYLSREQKLDRYQREWDPQYPTDVYRADVLLSREEGTLTLLMKMDTGKLVGWHDAALDGTTGQTPATLSHWDAKMARKAADYAAFFGIPKQDWQWNGAQDGADGQITFASRKKAIADALPQLHVTVPSDYSLTSSAFPAWKGGSVTYDFSLPESFIAYIGQQTRLADTLNTWGFVVPQLVLLVLAIVYAASRREHTSFRRGIWFSSLFFVLYVVFTFNMIPGFRANVYKQGFAADDPVLGGMIAANLIVLAGMAIFTYFSAVGGDGLWNAMGRSLWPRWRQPAFGAAVVESMKKGYLLAFVLLGAQSVILVGLGKAIGMFQSSDPTQSTYNMTYPWLLLLLAWCAGISEETQSRLFGVGLFRSWLVGGARRMLRREPSPRTASALTAVAMLPPGLFWAFGHVGYAVYPAYSRLIELILMGMLFGWFMLRFGFMAVVFAHVILDSTLMSVQLMFDGLPGDLAAGLLGLILPAIVAYALRWLHGSRRGSLRPRVS